MCRKPRGCGFCNRLGEGGDALLNAPIREDDDAGERQDWLVDDSPSQEGILIKNEELEKSAPGA